MTDNQQLIAWLNDAYSMERSLANVLKNHVKDAADFPEIQDRLERHRQETEHHVKLVEECLSCLGEKPSATKGVLGSAMGKVEGAATGIFRDEIVKNLLMDFSAEHLEIASYTSLIAAAEELGQPRIAEICQEILEEELETAEWLRERIADVTVTTLRQRAAA